MPGTIPRASQISAHLINNIHSEIGLPLPHTWQMRKMRHREVKTLIPGHTDNMYNNWDSSPGSSQVHALKHNSLLPLFSSSTGLLSVLQIHQIHSHVTAFALAIPSSHNPPPQISAGPNVLMIYASAQMLTLRETFPDCLTYSGSAPCPYHHHHSVCSLSWQLPLSEIAFLLSFKKALLSISILFTFLVSISPKRLWALWG